MNWGHRIVERLSGIAQSQEPRRSFPRRQRRCPLRPGPAPPTAALAPSQRVTPCNRSTSSVPASSAPEGASAEDIEYRAECLRKADMHRLALVSVKARRARRPSSPGRWRDGHRPPQPPGASRTGSRPRCPASTPRSRRSGSTLGVASSSWACCCPSRATRSGRSSSTSAARVVAPPVASLPRERARPRPRRAPSRPSLPTVTTTITDGCDKKGRPTGYGPCFDQHEAEGRLVDVRSTSPATVAT